MIKRTLFTILISGVFLLGCKDDKQGKTPDYWLDNNPKTTQYPPDTSYLQKTTVLNWKINPIMNFLRLMDNIKRKDSCLTKEELILIADSLSKSLNLPINAKSNLVFDKNYISNEKIKHSNQLAYRALLESSWKKRVSFADYREYILPYKLTNEIFDTWRDSLYSFHQKLIALHPEFKNIDSLHQYHISKTYNALSSKVAMRKYFSSEENYTWLNITKEGDCVSRCRYALYHLRAAGAPATFDYIPDWGNRPYSQHAYIGLANKKRQVPILLRNDNNTKNLIEDLNAAMDPKKTLIFAASELPKGLYVEYEKTIPKLYRQTWSSQTDMTTLLSKIPTKEFFPGLIKPNMLDVTAQYLQVASVETSKSFFERKRTAYLATFDTKNWTPVAFTTFNWFGKAVFKDVGKNILYLPMTYNGILTAYENPFILENSGAKRVLTCNKEKRINMKLIRKFPLFSYTANHSVDLKGCRIEGSNSADFKDVEILHTIDYLTFNTKQINFKNPIPFRYIRMVAPDGVRLRIAEMECFQDNRGVLKKMEDVNYKKGRLEGQDSYAFDGDLNTYLVGKPAVFDFGRNVPVSRIRFTPMNDSNYIIPGYKYELFYWDNRWVSVGKKLAKSDSLHYTNIPSGTIYWLKCLSGGKEERIFTYENDMQIWW
jgi:hypothetical protein